MMVAGGGVSSGGGAVRGGERRGRWGKEPDKDGRQPAQKSGKLARGQPGVLGEERRGCAAACGDGRGAAERTRARGRGRSSRHTRTTCGTRHVARGVWHAACGMHARPNRHRQGAGPAPKRHMPRAMRHEPMCREPPGGRAIWAGRVPARRAARARVPPSLRGSLTLLPPPPLMCHASRAFASRVARQAPCAGVPRPPASLRQGRTAGRGPPV